MVKGVLSLLTIYIFFSLFPAFMHNWAMIDIGGKSSVYPISNSQSQGWWEWHNWWLLVLKEAPALLLYDPTIVLEYRLLFLSFPFLSVAGCLMNMKTMILRGQEAMQLKRFLDLLLGHFRFQAIISALIVWVGMLLTVQDWNLIF